MVAVAGWLILSATAFYGHLRLMGSDERAAYTSGVRISVVRIGAHVVCGLFAGLAALSFTALIDSGDPTQGTTYTLISVTALVLGGTSLGGGRATVFGSLLGAINLYLITYVLSTFNFGAVQSFVTDLAYGAILVLSLLLTVAALIQRCPALSPLLFFVVLVAVLRRRPPRDLRLYGAPRHRGGAAAGPLRSTGAGRAAGVGRHEAGNLRPGPRAGPAGPDFARPALDPDVAACRASAGDRHRAQAAGLAGGRAG